MSKIVVFKKPGSFRLTFVELEPSSTDVGRGVVVDAFLVGGVVASCGSSC